MNELSEAVKLSMADESSEEPAPLADVQVIVDESNRMVKLVWGQTMVHSGGIAFEVLTPGWEFTHQGGVHGVDFAPTANDPFQRHSETPTRIVFRDLYVKGDPSTDPYEGLFNYTVTVQKSGLAPLSAILRLFGPQQIDEFELVVVNAPVFLASVLSTSGVVVNQ